MTTEYLCADCAYAYHYDDNDFTVFLDDRVETLAADSTWLDDYQAECRNCAHPGYGYYYQIMTNVSSTTE